MGNRIYGCDDCLAVCPWNKFARATRETKLAARDDLVAPPLADLAALDDAGLPVALLRLAGEAHRPRPFRPQCPYRCSAIPATRRSFRPSRPASTDASPLVRGAAVWAFGELDRRAARYAREHRLPNETDPQVMEEWHAIA